MAVNEDSLYSYSSASGMWKEISIGSSRCVRVTLTGDMGEITLNRIEDDKIILDQRIEMDISELKKLAECINETIAAFYAK
jgi:hypothetical protein